ncbi:PEX22 (YAL055W) [Zygosaccharomyces parabailii]|uniref:Peroxisome assembly protein 22 n=1 Tax=Zygosaccharomyces bailii (strain CLIB 213 / ATCC 58445 / CBS 680 / BCRC 21525 / NBRC 1098 / NCYC 1416 / NRRL Y-2227) TaxID=1333698 RepID=A0A8J2T952_ZYGB2|nr:PEX22 (YAL055W) [Zygosaccharomyces parabailii]CDF90644.1 ZYBA0S07-05820g1_1 [Zygosaccharomyces bailii CLIB 213]CDH14986.1 uncharacterized protein ZBAI_06772 [Zygosaccharomyces bailii ISA1307]
MVQRRPKAPYNWLRIGGAATVAAAGIGLICYIAWTSCSSNPERQGEEKNSKKTSKTIVVTNTISCQKEISWGDLLEKDVVLLVPPGVSFLENPQDELSLHYKIIRCNKMAGLWSCVRHLRKDQLLYVAGEIAEDIPEDIPRYVKRVTALETNEQVRTSLS